METYTFTARQMADAVRRNLTIPQGTTKKEAFGQVLDAYGAAKYLQEVERFTITAATLVGYARRKIVPFFYAAKGRTMRFVRDELHLWVKEMTAILAQKDKARGATPQAMQEAARRVSAKLGNQRQRFVK